jgi:hypothetical protein
MKIVVIGGTGLIGSKTIALLHSAGHDAAARGHLVTARSKSPDRRRRASTRSSAVTRPVHADPGPRWQGRRTVPCSHGTSAAWSNRARRLGQTKARELAHHTSEKSGKRKTTKTTLGALALLALGAATNVRADESLSSRILIEPPCTFLKWRRPSSPGPFAVAPMRARAPRGPGLQFGLAPAPRTR